jgi:hypothetical protein
VRSFKFKAIMAMALLFVSHHSSAAWVTANIVTVKLESPEHVMVQIDKVVQECGGSSNIIFRDTFFTVGTSDQKKEMFNRIYSALLSSFIAGIPVVMGTQGCEGPSMKGVGIHLAKQ